MLVLRALARARIGMNGNGLILFSHGSLLCGAGETLNAHAERLRAGGKYAAVEVGYLNYSDPKFETAVERCVQAGVSRIVVVPYFLVAGKFVTADLPPRVDAARARYPEIEFVLADAILDSPGMADALVEMASGARPVEACRAVRAISKELCEERETCPAWGTALCPKSQVPQHNAGTMAVNGVAAEISGGAMEHKHSLEALLVMVHGSPRSESNDDVYKVLKVVRDSGTFDFVEAGFMECNEPNIPAAIASCIANGGTRITAVPYFLHTGKHVMTDLPGILNQAAMNHPNVKFVLGEFVGTSKRVTEILEEKAASALT